MTSTTTHRRSRKSTAVLAATAVLGVASVATLATWTVTEFVSGSFTTGSQNPSGALEASADGATYDFHSNEAGALTVSWDRDTTRLAGNESIAAPYFIRATTGTTANLRINVNSAATNDNGITYSVFAIDNSAVCDGSITASSAGVTQNLGSAALTSGLASSFNLAGGTDVAPGAAQKLCIKVNVPDSAAQNVTTNATFSFVAQQ